MAARGAFLLFGAPDWKHADRQVGVRLERWIAGCAAESLAKTVALEMPVGVGHARPCALAAPSGSLHVAGAGRGARHARTGHRCMTPPGERGVHLLAKRCVRDPAVDRIGSRRSAFKQRAQAILAERERLAK